MKRQLSILTFVLIASLVVHGQTVKKQIKTEKEYTYKVKDGKQDSIGTLTTTKQYDRKGNMTLEINYCKYSWDCEQHPDSFKSKYEYKYDDKNNLIERNYYENGQPLAWSMTKYSYKTNEKEKIIEKTILTTQSFDQHKKFYYDKDVETYSYNNSGLLVKEISTSIDSSYSFDFVTNYKYDKNENLIEVQLSKNKKLYTYDTKGNCIKYELKGRHTCADDIVKWEKKFDENGNIIEKTTCNDRPRCWTDKFIYNDNNQRIKTLSSNKSGQTV